MLPHGWVAFSATAAPQSYTQEYSAHWWLPMPVPHPDGCLGCQPNPLLRYSAVLAKERGAMYAQGYAGQVSLPALDHACLCTRF